VRIIKGLIASPWLDGTEQEDNEEEKQSKGANKLTPLI
jgi:hypothetical protein